MLGRNSIWGEEIQKIKKLYQEKAECQSAGGVYKLVNIQQEYCNYLVESFKDLRGVNTAMVLDCGNGAVGAVLRGVVESIGLTNVTFLCEQVDGTYPNHNANPVDINNMRHAQHVLEECSADIAIGFDGDGDRMAALTHEGQLLIGDHLLSLFAADVLSRSPQATIVFDGKCSLVVAETIKNNNGIPVRSPSGHSIIKTAMRKHGALLGGELSCHFFFADDYFGFDDGIYAFLRLIRLMKDSGRTLKELVSSFPHTYITPEIRIFCPDERKESIVEQVKQYIMLQGLYALSFDDGVRFENEIGWGMIRASNTQPELCIRCESLTPQGLQGLKKTVYDAVSATLILHNATPDTYNMRELL